MYSKSVGNDLFGIGRKFDVACFIKADGRLAQPDAAFLVQIVIFKAVKAVVDDDVFMDSVPDDAQIFLRQPLLPAV